MTYKSLTKKVTLTALKTQLLTTIAPLAFLIRCFTCITILSQARLLQTEPKALEPVCMSSPDGEEEERGNIGPFRLMHEDDWLAPQEFLGACIESIFWVNNMIYLSLN